MAFRKYSLLLIALSAVFPGFFFCSCGPRPVTAEQRAAFPAKVRFLLTFDDGPSAKTGPNPTEAVLDRLRSNRVENNIKAIFFLQTRYSKAGGAVEGRY
jgi:peptidoglycan/xylan/chitin deacetylase (PgdA/CDA1 family)